MNSRSAPPRPRYGFTLIELLVTLVMFSIVGASIISVLNGQQRFGRASSEIGRVRSQMQAANMVLPAELRMVSPTDHDILDMTASSITIQSTIGRGVVCSRAGQVVTLEPTGSVASLLTAPAVGDSVFIWADITSARDDDTWRSAAAGTPAYAVSAVATGTCAAPLTATSTGTYDLTIANATTLRPAIAKGAPLVITRRVTYGLYQSAADSKWYLGYKAAGAASYEYVAGPFRSSSEQGIQFRYYTKSDVELTGASLTTKRDSVARIALAARVKSATPIALGGGPNRTFVDSLKLDVALRNRIDY